MVPSKFSVECPDCGCMIEVGPPDRKHTVASLTRPGEGCFRGNIIEQESKCRCGKCEKTVKTYWYEPAEACDQTGMPVRPERHEAK